MTKDEAIRKLGEWVDREVGDHGFQAMVEYIHSRPTWPRTVNDVTVKNPTRRAYFRIVLSDENMSDEDFRASLAGARGHRMQSALGHLWRRAEEDTTLRGLITDDEELETEFAERGGEDTLNVALTIDE